MMMALMFQDMLNCCLSLSVHGAWCSVVAKALRNWSDGLGIDSRLCHWRFFP